jgi:hypothetical protein
LLGRHRGWRFVDGEFIGCDNRLNRALMPVEEEQQTHRSQQSHCTRADNRPDDQRGRGRLVRQDWRCGFFHCRDLLLRINFSESRSKRTLPWLPQNSQTSST